MLNKRLQNHAINGIIFLCEKSHRSILTNKNFYKKKKVPDANQGRKKES